MFRYAFRTLRARKAGFTGALLALFCAAAMVVACGALLETGLRGSVETERYSAAPIVVAGDQNVHQVEITEKADKPDKVKRKSKRLFERVWLPESVVSTARSVPGVESAVPEVNFPAYLVDSNGSIVRGPGGQPSWGHAWTSAVLTPFTLVEGEEPSGPRDVVIDSKLARRSGVQVGDHVTVQATRAPTEYRVAGVAATEGAFTQQSSLFFTAAEADRLSGRTGQVAVVGVFPAPGTDVDQLRDDVAAALAGTTAQVHAAAGRGAVEFLDASNARVELISMGGAMAATSVLVAVLVVVGTFALSVQQRYRELALLRAVAATPRQVRQLIGREAIVVGMLAGLPGAAAGIPLAGRLRELFVELGAIPENLHLVISPAPVAGAVLLAVMGAWLAARISGRRTSRIRPAEALSEASASNRLIAAPRLLAGIGAMVAGIVLIGVLSRLRTEPAAQPVTFLVVVVLATAVALLGPVIVRAAMAVAGPFLRLSPVGGYLAVANARANAGRLASALTPLSLLVAMACTVVFVGTTMSSAAQREIDAGVTADRTLVANGPGVPGALADEVRELPGVEAVTETVRTTVRVGLDRREVQGVTAEGLRHTTDLDVLAGSVQRLGDDGVALSELAADTAGVTVGEALELTMGDGTPLTLDVVAVYGRGLGFGDLTMSRDLVADHVDNPLNSTVLVSMEDGAGVEGLRALAETYPGIRILDGDATGAVEAEQQRSEAQVNAVALGLVVVFTTIAAVNTLAMSTAERFREFALLRLVGASRRQVRRMLCLEALAVAAMGILLGSAISLATLVAFSTGMTGAAVPSINPAVYAGVVGSALLLAVLATLVPGRVTIAAKPQETIGLRE